MKFDIIINEASKTGEGASRYDEVRWILRENKMQYRVHRTLYAGHATVIARELCSSPDKAVNIIVVGGDGTLNEVVNGITDFEKVRVGLIPNGSANDFAAGVHISSDVEKEIKAMIANADDPGSVDIGQVSYREGTKTRSRLFCISSGLGIDAMVCKKASTTGLKAFLNKIGLGKLTYVLLTVYSLVSVETADAVIEGIADDGSTMPREEIKKVYFSAAMNLRCEGGGVPMAPRAVASDRTLTLCCAHGIPKWRAFLCFPFLLTGKQSFFKCFDTRRFRELKIRLSKPVTLHADGEYCGEVNRAAFKILPGRLLFLNDIV